MAAYHEMKAAVYGILRDDDGRVLLSRRFQTGYMDGMIGLPSGHVEKNESFVEAIIRELYEEVAVRVESSAVSHSLTLHRYQPSGAYDYVDVFFEISSWTGVPKNNEPEKCSEVIWVNPNDREELIPYLKTAFKHIDNGLRFVEIERGDDE